MDTKQKVALISGVTGQDGSYLAELLLSKGYQVHGLKRRSSSFNTQRIDHIYVDRHNNKSRFHLHFGDMTDSSSLIRLVSEIEPTEIYNLAAQSHVQVSFETPEYTANADAMGAMRFLEAIRVLGRSQLTKFYQASTSEMYGVSSQKILDENSNFKPRSPYGIAKLYAYWMTVNYREAYGIYAVNGILFNHESPRRGETFVTQKIIKAAVKSLKDPDYCLYLGNLEAIRDWGHAKDYVEGMWRMMQHPIAEDWVLATGKAISVREFTELVFWKLGKEISWRGSGLDEIGVDQNNQILIRIDPTYFRPTEVPFLLGNSAKAKNKLGWEPKYSLEQLVDEMINSELQSRSVQT